MKNYFLFLFMSLFAVANAQTPIAQWKFEDNTLEENAIAHGNVQPGAYVVPYSTDAKEGNKSIAFDGNFFLNSLDPIVTDNLDAFTISFWMKLNGSTAGELQTIYSKSGEYRVLIENQKIHFVVATENVPWYVGGVVLSTSTVPADEWIYVTVLYDSGNTLAIYINGVLDNQLASSVTGKTLNTNNAILIGASGINLMAFKGQLDDLRFYNTALDAATIQMLYDSNSSTFATSISQPELIVNEAPIGSPVNSTFSVFVRYDGGEWIDLHEYDAGVDGGFGTAPLGHMSFVNFDSDFSKRIDVKIIKHSGTINDVQIRPGIDGIQHTLNGNIITFSLTEPKKLSVEINGDLLNNLMIFANSLETETPPDPNDPNVHYFGPGIHKLGGDGKGTLQLLNNNEKVYIAGGAIVYGSIYAGDPNYNPLDNISITGRGILCGGMYTNHAYPHQGEAKGSIIFNVLTNSKIDGITILNTVKWNIHLMVCEGIEITNVKAIGWTINSDGIDPQVCSNVLIDDCFVRNFDDCVAIKLSWFGGGIQPQGCDNITIQNCVFWTDQGRAILIGPECASTTNKVFENITIRDVDVLYTENYDFSNGDWAKGTLAINAGDDVTIRNIIFEDIRVDKLGDATNLINLDMNKTPYSGTEGARIENISFNRISLNMGLNLDNRIQGFDSSKNISGVYFDDLKINGSYITNAAQGNFNINQYAEDIRFNCHLQWKFEDNTLEEKSIAHGSVQPEGYFVAYSTDAIEGNKSIVFDGNSYLNCSDPVVTDNLDAFTISFWMKLDDATAGDLQTILTKEEEYRVLVENQKIHFVVATENVPWYSGGVVLSTSTISTDEWVHVAVLYDSGNTMAIYLNGVLDNQLTSSVTGKTLNTGNAVLIGAAGSNLRTFKGQLDDLRFCNTALDSTNIRDLYANVSMTISAMNKYDPERNINSDISIDGAVTALNEYDSGGNINLYPNPANNKIFIENLSINSKIRIFTQQGKIVFKTILKEVRSSVDISNFINGVYFVTIENTNNRYIKKFTVSR